MINKIKIKSIIKEIFLRRIISQAKIMISMILRIILSIMIETDQDSIRTMKVNFQETITLESICKIIKNSINFHMMRSMIFLKMRDK
jgi:hypothetical protein